MRLKGERGGIGGDIADTRVHNVRATVAYTYVKITVAAESSAVRGRWRPPARAGHRYYMSGTTRYGGGRGDAERV